MSRFALFAAAVSLSIDHPLQAAEPVEAIHARALVPDSHANAP